MGSCSHKSNFENNQEMYGVRNTSTAKRAHILSLWASITPFKMVNPSPLIKSAISKKTPRCSQSICGRGTLYYLISFSILHNIWRDQAMLQRKTKCMFTSTSIWRGGFRSSTIIGQVIDWLPTWKAHVAPPSNFSFLIRSPSLSMNYTCT